MQGRMAIRETAENWTRAFRARAVAIGVPEESILLVFVAALCVAFQILQPLFFSGANIQNLTRQGSILAIMAAGEIFVILGGGIDISVGGQVSVLSIAAVYFSLRMPLTLALILTVLLGCGFGLVNGVLVTALRVSPIIATIGTWQLLQGWSVWYTNGLPLRNFDPAYNELGGGQIGFLPIPTLIAIIAFLVAWFVLRRMRAGRYVYAVGGNAEAAKLSGVNVRAVTVLSYVLCSFFTAIAAITLSSRVSSGLPDLGSGLELTTIAAVFIGGVAWGGGAGSIVGVMLGAALLSILSNGFDLLAVNSNVQTMATGLLMVLAVIANNFRRRRVAN
jgi:ribose/xylose/arabinose/galactoside ABC-type transport system permease subunit